MRLRIEKLDTRFPYGKIPLLLFFFLLAIYFIFYLFVPYKIPLCWFKSLTHINCPTCGLYRAFTALLQGHIITAISYNPLMLFLTIFLIIQLICTTLFKIKISLKAKVKEKHWILFFFIIAFIANWLYII
ncbi:MAG TPA: DUF2752 domain-containing protein [Candidatus Syntrophosphaera thermopropionivorans]|nr:DUF2752 domain-containing protein [Candidatus Syntrophosphaera thermopropionivorans]HOL33235.1 DUF2752 domain-containing protein [Candidatus Syntrophosphaera thermopropionivorans]